ncbi:MAG: 4'-phosphopantetheinyl transferase superfamily protein [Chlamydiia bacterium]|nr:4'-phosphopantetheinyl transferase superfamily protein [Chlamydiia bacterium]
MDKQVLFFHDEPPRDNEAIHIWLGAPTASHEMALHQVLSRYLGTSSFTIDENAQGKHYLLDSSLHFNLSHSGEWLAIALSWEAPVGVDIEVIRPIDGVKQLILDHFSAKEQAYIGIPDIWDRDEACFRFWEIWSRKEACLKALGIGLQESLKGWDCFGDDWVNVNKVWVKSVPTKYPLSLAVAIDACSRDSSCKG